MIRTIKPILFLLISTLAIYAQAQSNDITLPNPNLITVLQLDDLHVSIVGDVGSAIPYQELEFTNLYSNHTGFAEASADGSFTATVFGQEKMPFIMTTSEEWGWPYREGLPSNKPFIILYQNYESEPPISFGIGGWVAFGNVPWVADGEINSLDFTNGDNFNVTINFAWSLISGVDFRDRIRESPSEFRMEGDLGLRKLDPDSAIADNEDNWSHKMTESGISLISSEDDIFLVSAETSEITFNLEEGILSFTLDFVTQLNNLPEGIYVPTFVGKISVNDEDAYTWYGDGYFLHDGYDGILLQYSRKPHPIVFPFTITISGE